MQTFHFRLIKELHYTIEGFWFSACGCGVDTDSTTNSVSEACVLAKTEASSKSLNSNDFRRQYRRWWSFCMRLHPDKCLDRTRKQPYNSGPYEIAHKMV